MKKFRSDKWYQDHDLTGKTFGRLTVIGLSDLKNDKNRSRLWICKCECGNTVVKDTIHLKNGHAKSCGCLKAEHEEYFKKNLAGQVTHNMSRERIFRIWSAMIKRCEDPNCKAYDNYGGRGISVCDEWKDLNKFKEWAINNGYQSNLSIDRIDTNGNYSPENCRWADAKTQGNNKRNNVIITYNGVTHTLSEWSSITGIKQGTIRNRLHSGWSVDDILNTPVITGRHCGR